MRTTINDDGQTNEGRNQRLNEEGDQTNTETNVRAQRTVMSRLSRQELNTRNDRDHQDGSQRMQRESVIPDRAATADQRIIAQAEMFHQS